MLEHLLQDYKQALRDKQEPHKTVLNVVIAQIKNKQIELQQEVSDQDIKDILRKEAKSIQETMSYMESADKAEARALEQKKLEIIQSYLPPLMDRQQTHDLIAQLMQQHHITDPISQRGQLMGVIMKEYKEQVDPTIVNQIISSWNG
jgi:uncharacterized protein